MLDLIFTTVGYAGLLYCGIVFIFFVMWFSAFSLGGE